MNLQNNWFRKRILCMAKFITLRSVNFTKVIFNPIKTQKWQDADANFVCPNVTLRGAVSSTIPLWVKLKRPKKQV